MKDDTTDNTDNSSSPPIKINRQYQTNPFKDRPTRFKFISTKHDLIFKQFSSTHFQVPSTNNLISPATQKLISAVTNNDNEQDINTDSQHASNDTDSSDEANDDIDVDDTGPLIFGLHSYVYIIYV